jgi:hypothetical protein
MLEDVLGESFEYPRRFEARGTVIGGAWVDP